MEIQAPTIHLLRDEEDKLSLCGIPLEKCLSSLDARFVSCGNCLNIAECAEEK